MRKFTILSFILLAVIVVSSCKKKSDDTPAPVNPSFIMSAIPDQYDANAVYFLFKCTNMDIKLTKIIISDPLTLFSDTYDLQGTTYLQNTAYIFGSSYTKETGNWSFQFTGNRQTDNTSFVVTALLYISK